MSSNGDAVHFPFQNDLVSSLPLTDADCLDTAYSIMHMVWVVAASVCLFERPLSLPRPDSLDYEW